jgi:hypothetical protein
MGLDIYAGPLCRYYSGNWQSIVQKAAAEQGIPLRVIRPGAGGLAGLLQKFGSLFSGKRDPVQAVRRWRQELASDMPWVPAEDWDWPESLDLEYQTDKPDFSGYGAVELWAAYTECSDLARPQETPEDWSNDAAFQRLADFSAVFGNIIGPELWLPIHCEKPFEVAEPNGIVRRIGSVFELLAELRNLNERTWKAAEDAIRKWSRDEYDPANLESIARWGFSIWYCLTEFAVARRAPIRLDY